MGPEYTGSRIRRDVLNEDENDDDPFDQFEEDEEEDEEEARSAGLEGHDSPDEEMTGPSDNDENVAPGGPSPSDSQVHFDEPDYRPKILTPGYSNENTETGSETPEEDIEDVKHSADDTDSPSDSHSNTSLSSSDAASVDGAPRTKSSAQRAQLREMMAESQKSVLSNISAAAKADAAKGKAIKKQRSTFDSLLNTRIKLQNALIAMNSLAVAENPDPAGKNSDNQGPKAFEAAERAALNLWNTIDSLRNTLPPQPSTSKPHTPATPSTSTTTLWARTHANDTLCLPRHRTTLTKWSNKINPPPLISRSKFSQPPPRQPLTSVLDLQLSGTQGQKHLERARTPRSCAPLQAGRRGQSNGNGDENRAVYDDADFYAGLLRELVEQRMADGASVHTRSAVTNGNGTAPLLPGMKDRALRVKKNVDTKASKGRKMRYTVHEKLQNFMAPEDRGAWGERQRGELFGGLLGRKVEMGEGSEDEDMDGVGEGRREEEALMLFRR